MKLLIANVFTGILFYVDEQGIYRRGPLFIVQYALAYAYVFFTCFRAFLGGADKILDTLTSKKAYAKRPHLHERSDCHRTHFV